MRPGALFGFTVEALEAGTYVLHPSRRYAHSEQYVRDVAARAGLEPVSMTRAALRTEKKQDVFGLITILRKPAGKTG
jgi:predicted TPR repeat methyltransferase